MPTPSSGQISLSQITAEACQTGDRRFRWAAVESLVSTNPSQATPRNFGQYYGVRGDRVGFTGSQINIVSSIFTNGIRFLASGQVQKQQASGSWTFLTNWDAFGEVDSVAEATDYRITWSKVSGDDWDTLPASGSFLNTTRTFTSSATNAGTYDITITSRWRSCDTGTRRVYMGQ